LFLGIVEIIKNSQIIIFTRQTSLKHLNNSKLQAQKSAGLAERTTLAQSPVWMAVADNPVGIVWSFRKLKVF